MIDCDALGAPLMGKSGEYRRYAAECLELANTFRTPEARAALLLMAQVWSRLGDREEAPPVPAGDDGYFGR